MRVQSTAPGEYGAPTPRRAISSKLIGRWLAGTGGRALVLVLALAVTLFIGLLALFDMPAVVPATAPATEFSAARAMQHLRVIAAESRAVGTPGHEAARRYLVDQLQAMGLEPEVQNASAVMRFPGNDVFGAGAVTNVVTRVPGTDSTGAIALNAHYDSGPTGPGASDCGSCVVTVLETLRALQAGPALRNDLIVVFSDAEENQDLGAAAFNREHPWARDVRLALNFEALGSGGPALLYATSRDNGWLTGEFFAVAPNPRAYSLLPQIVLSVPMLRAACDLQDYLDNGSAGLGFIYVADTPAYHTMRDSVAEIDPRSIQHEGDYALAAVRHFGNLDLARRPRSPDRVFFNVLPGVMVHYGGGWVIPLAALATALVVAVIVIGFRRKQLTSGGLMAGALAFMFGAVATVVLVTLLWVAIWSANSDYQVFLAGTYQANFYIVALSFAALALMAALYALLRRRVRLHNLAAGALLIWTPLLWLISLTAPGMSYLVLWPLLFGLLPLAWASASASLSTSPAGRRAQQPWWRLAILVVAAIPAVILLPATFYQVVPFLSYVGALMGIPLLGLLALFVAPLGGLLVLHFDLLAGESTSGRRWLVPGILALVAVALIVWANATSGFDAAQPRTDRIAYELDADSGETRWVSPDRHLDAWTAQFFPAGTIRGDAGFAAPAPAVPLAALEATVLSDTAGGDVRTLRLRLSSPRGADEFQVSVAASGEIVTAAVDGRPLDLSDYSLAREGRLYLTYAGVQPAGAELTLAVRSPGPITIDVAETTSGLPDLPGMTIRPRPADIMPALGFPRDPTIVRRTFTY